MKYVIYASVIHMLFPINYIMEWFFLRKTKRKASSIDINLINECILFVASVMLYDNYLQFYGVYDPNNKLARNDMSADELYIINLVWD